MSKCIKCSGAARRAGALLLAAVLWGQMLLPALAAEGNTIYISNVRELIRLSEQCVSDTWSQGVTVVLTADLHLASSGFTPIPVFGGTFDGAGHSITGFVCTGRGSDTGLFRYLREGAVVKNLTLDAVVAPEGTATGVGALAGQNLGVIEHVAVTGSVDGEEDVGGLVGVNGESGVLRNCTNRASLTGVSRTGGLAGSNKGRIEDCTNYGAVNNTDAAGAEDTGGITGQNTGIIQNCANRGTVGYPHVGYNVGGIAGRQNGTITSSVNSAPVSGRKDVGGIVGQFEPYSVFTYGEDPAAKLDEAMSALFALMDRLAGQVNRLTGDAVEDVEAVNDSLSALRDTVHQSGTEALEDLDVTGSRVYDGIQDMNRAISNLLVYWDVFSEEAGGDLEQFNRHLARLGGAVDGMLGAVDTGISDSFAEVSRSMDRLEADSAAISRHMSGMADEVRRLKGFLQDAVQAAAALDLEGIAAAFSRWDVGSIDLGGHIQGIGSRLHSMGSGMGTLWDGLSSIQSESSDSLNSARADADASMAALQMAFDSLSGHMSDFSGGASQSLQLVNDRMDYVEDTVKAYLDQLNAQSQLRLDEMNAHLEDVSRQVDRITQGTAAGSDELHATTTAIIAQLDRARQAVTDLVQGPEKTVEDASQEELTGPGLVSACRNSAAVQGDNNTGGIAGIVAPEISADPEQDIDLEVEELLVDTVITLTATLHGCENRGEVSSKNGCAGGILGRAEAGAALACASYGAVSSSGGGQCGGIAGRSRGTIRDCAAQVDLSGGDELGGIAGLGMDISRCTAMTRVLEGGERIGAIAGWAEGEVSENYYLRERTAAIDGIDYTGRAEPLDWPEFSALEGVPADFLNIQVVFQAGERVVKRVTVPYGGRLDPESFPAVPPQEGDYGQWEEFDYANITRSIVVEARYSGWVTAISSGGERPLLLAQGDRKSVV